MTPFTRLDAIAAPLALANVDTDAIIPARYLKTISREGLGEGLFAALRQAPSFVLNRPPWDRAGIVVALDNFGCGSSREHAVWALLDRNIRCVIAPSIADIFFSNCCKNGILPVMLPAADVQYLLAEVGTPATARLVVDLPAQTVETSAGRRFRFDFDPGRRKDLIDGIDEIGRSLAEETCIRRFETDRIASQPWIRPITQAALDATAI